ncbi:MAG TPA: histidine kinase [Lachnospiraceae bacterium]|nr:histidine kinase [Lachnospiraceae bacterium]
MNKRKIFGNLTIQTKLIFVFILTSMFIFAVNLYVYVNLNSMIGKIDEIYASNVSLNEMTETLNSVQNSMTDYLKTKSTDALGLYYKSVQTYNRQLTDLNVITTNNDMKLMEKSIRNMSETYLNITNETVQAKRGRNVERYISGHEEATRLFSYINTYIYSLNNEQFKSNSTNYETLLSSLKYSEVLCLSILVVVAFCNTLIIILVTRSITNPLKELSRQADEIAQGRLDVELLEVKSADEVGVVTKGFNQMLLSIREYISQIRVRMEMESAMKEKELMMAAHLKDAQLKYLQAQTNPHFLFNTLNAGAQLAMMEGADKTNRYVQNMADFFRYNVKKDKEDVTIAEEIELVDSYIYILNVRFSGDIHFRKEIDESLLQIRIPSMIIQPIVENSVNYGIRNIEWEGLIILSLYREGDKVCISVKDNGVGISKERIEKILAQEIEPSNLSNDSNGIGLANVIARLKLFFGREDIFSIKSDGENKGTETIVCIPIK